MTEGKDTGFLTEVYANMLKSFAEKTEDTTPFSYDDFDDDYYYYSIEDEGSDNEIQGGEQI